MKLRVEGNERLVRDSNNFAILNTDRNALTAHEQKLEKLRREKVQEEKINNLERDMSEIKDMLAQLLKSK
jgi:hypothetical protein